MKRQIKKIIENILEVKHEEQKLKEFLCFLNIGKSQKVLDIGCGYGQKMKILMNLGIETTGIDINEHIVRENRKAGLNCITIQEFEQSNTIYDALLMSHFIEHFQPKALLDLIDLYLDRLKDSGHLIISTPLNSPYFYDDFDHVKPYHPIGIHMVFCNHQSQVQYYSKNKLELVDIWFRKEPFKLHFFSGLYIKKYSKLPLIVNIISTLIFYMSFRVIGRTDGWIGLYRKVGSS